MYSRIKLFIRAFRDHSSLIKLLVHGLRLSTFAVIPRLITGELKFGFGTGRHQTIVTPSTYCL